MSEGPSAVDLQEHAKGAFKQPVSWVALLALFGNAGWLGLDLSTISPQEAESRVIEALTEADDRCRSELDGVRASYQVDIERAHAQASEIRHEMAASIARCLEDAVTERAGFHAALIEMAQQCARN